MQAGSAVTPDNTILLLKWLYQGLRLLSTCHQLHDREAKCADGSRNAHFIQIEVAAVQHRFAAFAS